MLISEADQIHKRATVVIDHDHRPIGTDIPLMKTGGVTAKVYQVSLDVDLDIGYKASAEKKNGWLRLAAQGVTKALEEIEAHAPDCVLAKTASDIRLAKAADQVAILLGVEGARWLEESLEPLSKFHSLGLRELQLTWAYPNALVPDGRLSAFGREVVSECGRLGVIVDVTHIPRAAFDDVAEQARLPIIVSHGAAQRVTKDLDDTQLRAIADTGGVLGIHFYITYLGPNPTPADVVKQIDYVADLVGIDHIALGVDFFPTDGVWYDLQVAQGATNLQWAVEDMSGMPEITRCLVDHGYAEEDIHKILGRNFLRVCETVFGA
ncbi:MAG: membrane dipeptidase [Gemmatimonadota bacterium]|nr:membrane dipeptidase [Gemmatimonadota bacterium]